MKPKKEKNLAWIMLGVVIIMAAVIFAVGEARAENVTSENKTAETVSGCENLLTEMDSGIAQKVGNLWCSLKSGFKSGSAERGYDPFSLAFDLMVAGFGAVILLWLITKGGGLGTYVLYAVLIVLVLILLGII